MIHPDLDAIGCVLSKYLTLVYTIHTYSITFICADTTDTFDTSNEQYLILAVLMNKIAYYFSSHRSFSFQFIVFHRITSVILNASNC